MVERTQRCVAAFSILVGALAGTNSAHGQAIWDGSASNLWKVAANWSTGAVPTNATNAEVGAPAPTVVDAIAQAADLDVLAGGRIEIQGTTGSLTVNGTSLDNEGEIVVNINEAAGNGSALFINGGATLEGTGSVLLYANGRLQHLGAGTAQFTQAADHTIRGEGIIYATS